MKTRTKALLLTLCAVVLTAVTAYGTYAYFTDKDADVNTFTVGSVHIDLDEAEVNEDGTVKSEKRVKENKYHLIPGHTYIKDPIVHVADNSESAWLFVEVNNGIADIEGKTDKGTIAEQIAGNGWEALDAEQYPGIYYQQYTKGGEKNFVVFEEFKVDGDTVTKEILANYKEATVTITAYAIQAAGFDDAVSAWIALQAQLNPNP